MQYQWFMNYAIAFLLAAFSLSSAMAADLFKLSTEAISLSKKDFADTIKVRVIGGAVIVPVEIEGQTLNMLFDTGTPIGIWMGQKEAWMKQVTADSVLIHDANYRSHNRAIYQIPSVRIGNLRIENYPVIVGDAMSEFVCNKFDGAIGFNLTGKGLSFKLDTKDSLLIITDRKNFFAKEEKGLPSAKYNMKKSYCPEILIDTPLVLMETIFDTGAINIWLDLPEDALDLWFKNSPKKRKILDDMTIQTDTLVKAAAGFYGLSVDTVVGRLLHFKSLKIGNLPINDLYASTNCRSMRWGSAVLKHASLIIDAPRKRFVFQPHEGQGISVGNRETGSLSLIPTEKGDTLGFFKVFVRKGSKAYQKGIRTGDYLIEANGIPVKDFCTFMLMDRKGKEQLLKCRTSDGRVKEVSLERSNR